MSKALQDALQSLLNNYGECVLQDTNRIVGTIADFAPNNLKEKKMINIVIYENIPNELIKLKNVKSQIREIEVNKSVDKLMDEYGMRREIAEKILSYFTVALGFGVIKNGALINNYDNNHNKNISNNKFFEQLSIDQCIELGNRNNIKVQVYLGNQYLKGIRVKKDSKKAMYWFEKASRQNDLVALCNLAILRLQQKN